MPRKSNSQLEDGYIKSCWAECEEMTREFGRVVNFAVFPTNQRGVFYFQLSATKLVGDLDEVGRNDTIKQRYPNGSAHGLAFFLWDLSRRLNDQVTQLEEDAAPSPKTEG